MSGFLQNDGWRFEDNGTTRTQINLAAVVAAGYGHISIATPDGYIVLMGFYRSGYRNDVW